MSTRMCRSRSWWRSCRRDGTWVTPLFQVMMALQNEPKSVVEMSGIKLASLVSRTETTKFDLTLSLIESGKRLHGVCIYREDLFNGATIERLMRHWTTLLDR